MIKPLAAMTSVAIATAFVNFADASVTSVVTPSQMNGFIVQSAHCNGGTSSGNTVFESGPGTPVVGTGSLEFKIGADGDSFETVRNGNYDKVDLRSLTGLSYSTYIENHVDGQGPYIILNIDFDNNGTLDDQLFFEPTYQSGYSTNIPDQGALHVGEWQTWNAIAGGWWSLNGFAGATSGMGVQTLEHYLVEYPEAKIVNSSTGAGGIRIATGCGGSTWTNFVGNADNLRITTPDGSTTYDFEVTPPEATVKQN